MKKRPNGEGALFKRPGGKWQSQATIAGRRQSFYGNTQAVALDKMKAARAAAAAGTFTSADLLLGEYLNRWIEDRRGTVEISTWENDARMLRHHVIPIIGAKPLRDLTARDVNDLLANVKRVGGGAPLGSRIKAVIRTVLGHALHDAEADELIVRNAARLSRPIRQSQPEVEPFTMAEAQALVAASEASDTGAIFLTSLLLGLRQGEVLGLLWENLDLDAGVLRVRTHLKREGGAFVLGDLKTHQRSRRDLSLPPRLIDVLRRHRARQAGIREGAGRAWRPTWDLVFTTENGTPIEKTNFIRRQWRPFLRAAGVKYRPFHATRHTQASVAYSMGVPISEISRSLGHQSERTTQDIYQHTFAKLRSAAPQAVADALFEVPAGPVVGVPAAGSQ